MDVFEKNFLKLVVLFKENWMFCTENRGEFVVKAPLVKGKGFFYTVL